MAIGTLSTLGTQSTVLHHFAKFETLPHSALSRNTSIIEREIIKQYAQRMRNAHQLTK